MAEILAADSGTPAGLPAPPFPGGQGLAQLKSFIAQPAIARSLPGIAAVGAIATAGLLYMAIAEGPQRVLYSSLSDAERASVVEVLERGGVDYSIDSATGMLSVAEDDVYRARMMVASDSGIAAPQSATDMLDSIPLGASRTLEGERLRLARERELTLTIQEIDGISNVRVHLATPERSVFVRDNAAASASVMVRLTRGRTLGSDQVDAIVSLVSGSVPGLANENVRVVDHNGRLLSDNGKGALDGLLLQREMEAKLRDQLSQLLVPLLGEGNFSTEVQAEIDQDEITAARESYDREGVVRSESETSARRSAAAQVGGVPGVLSNTPPPPAQLVEGPPQEGQPEPTAAPPSDSETSMRRNYELGREVAVTSTRPGGLKRLSVAVAVSAAALKKIAPADEAKISALVGAAVGIDPERGDVVTVVTGGFEAPADVALAFYETNWFAMALRYGAAVLAVILVLLFGVRPLLKRLRKEQDGDQSEDGEAVLVAAHADDTPIPPDIEHQIDLARQLAEARPDKAAAALQRMLAPPSEEGATA